MCTYCILTFLNWCICGLILPLISGTIFVSTYVIPTLAAFVSMSLSAASFFSDRHRDTYHTEEPLIYSACRAVSNRRTNMSRHNSSPCFQESVSDDISSHVCRFIPNSHAAVSCARELHTSSAAAPILS